MKTCKICGERLRKNQECKYTKELKAEIKQNPNPKRLPYKDVPINDEADRTKDLYEELMKEKKEPMPGIDKWFNL